MKATIQRAESYCRTLRGKTEEQKQQSLFSKYGNVLGEDTCNRIAKDF